MGHDRLSPLLLVALRGANTSKVNIIRDMNDEETKGEEYRNEGED